jgi:hypothetical protein
LFDSGAFSLSSPNQLVANNTLENITISNLTVNLPANNTFTLGLTVQGLGAGTNIAVALYGTPTVGSDPGTYYLNNGSWTKYTNSNIGPVNFGASFLGTQTVPEPSVIYLGATGIAALLGASRLRRKK